MIRSLILYVLYFLVGCGGGGNDSMSYGISNGQGDALEYSEDMEVEPPRSTQAPRKGVKTLPVKEMAPKIIRSGNMSFEVTDLEKAKIQVDTLVSGFQGYFENESFNAYGNRKNYNLTLRVPNANFEKLISTLESGIGSLRSKNLNSKDVTVEFVDLNIRLENNLAYLKQYQTILKKAKSIKEILEVQEKIRRIEEEIDSKKGRLKFLNNKVNYSTLHLELSQLVSSSISQGPSFFKRIANAFKNGISGFLSFVVGLVNFWPFVLLLIAAFIGRKRIFSLFRRKKNK